LKAFNDDDFMPDDFVIFRPRIMWGILKFEVIFVIEEFNYITKKKIEMRN